MQLTAPVLVAYAYRNKGACAVSPYPETLAGAAWILDTARIRQLRSARSTYPPEDGRVPPLGRLTMASNDERPEPERGQLTPEERDALKRRAAELGKRLDEVRTSNAPQTRDNRARGAAMGDAFKIVAELVVGVAVGGGLGWALDRWLGTGPWLLVLFLLLGFAAGMSNVIRTARQMQARAEPLQRGAPAVADEDDDDDRADGANRPSGGGGRN